MNIEKVLTWLDSLTILDERCDGCVPEECGDKAAATYARVAIQTIKSLKERIDAWENHAPLSPDPIRVQILDLIKQGKEQNAEIEALRFIVHSIAKPHILDYNYVLPKSVGAVPCDGDVLRRALETEGY